MTLVPYCEVFCHKKQENLFVSQYALFYRLTRSHKEHREKGMFPFLYKKILCVLCVFV